MVSQALLQLFGLAVFSFLVALLALWALARLSGKTAQNSDGRIPIHDDGIAFLFEDQTLINATGAAQQLIASRTRDGTDWDRLHAVLEQQFPDLQDQLARLSTQGGMLLFSQDGSCQLRARWHDGITRIALSDPDRPDAEAVSERAYIEAMQTEINTLRATAETAPFLVWRQNALGAITWANNSYLGLAQAGLPDSDAPAWPPARLFDLTNSATGADTETSKRMTTHIVGEAEPRWFECFETQLGDESLFTAVAADKVVKAELALRDFVQTLTKTFAHLTVGLAIFDKQRRLALFNPALTDLTSLSASFLSSRPTFQAVLNQLRDKQMLPEPKDYKSWRHRLHDLEVEAVNGTYEESWHLTNERTYRVTGRPHPDGALAFLIEDISAEISSTRRFRAELNMSQATLDAIPEAIAVFSQTGALLLSNSAYSELWGISTTAVLGEFGIVDATRVWAENCAPSPAWGDVREFVCAAGERAQWSDEVHLRDGRTLRCRFVPISGGATLAGFSLPAAGAAGIPADLSPVEQLSIEIAAL